MRAEMLFDFKAPDYVPIYQQRIERLTRLREDAQLLHDIKIYYKDNIADFITDWGCTFDPRNPERNLPSNIPFLLFDKQREWVDLVIWHWRNGKPLLTEKTRDMGMSWLSIAVACSMCLFNPELVIGFGSRKEEYVDKNGDLKALLPKARMFLEMLPAEFLNGWTKKNTTFKLIKFDNGSQIVGESGDGIGRGARSSIYFLDESAFLERPHLTEASLSQTTNCRIDISTPNGFDNPFAQKRFSGKIKVFTFHWRDDPRKNLDWYKKQCDELDPVTVAQEIDINYAASKEGVVIPSDWIQAAVDAHIKLGIEETGETIAALDVADEGIDKNALAIRTGIVLKDIHEWSGQNSDLGITVDKACRICENIRLYKFIYDADGMGSGIKGFVRIANENRPANLPKFATQPFNAAGAVDNADKKEFGNRVNKDFFVNRKALAWWRLRKMFENTYHALNTPNFKYDPDEIISISSKMPLLNNLVMELSQPTYSINTAGKIIIDKKPDGIKSPNLADAIMMLYYRNKAIDYAQMQDYLRRANGG